MGYSPRALYDGAAAYVTRTPKSEQMRFPLKFLEDVGLVRSWCKAPPRTLDPTKLCKVESHWAYPFKAGLEFVVCPPTATREEAFRRPSHGRRVRQGALMKLSRKLTVAGLGDHGLTPITRSCETDYSSPNPARSISTD